MTTPTDKAPSEAEKAADEYSEQNGLRNVRLEGGTHRRHLYEAHLAGQAAHAERVRVDLEGVSRKMRTYLGLYPDDKELRAMIARMEAYDREGK